MRDTTVKQIEAMKAQTFGVEIEMNHITRENAATIAAGYFGTARVENTARRNGYYTWSAWDSEGREWKFQKDVSIAGPDDEKCELVTPILTYKDMETLQDLVRKLRKAGARSNPRIGCGVHIHIGLKSPAGDHNAKTLRNLANIMAAREDLLINAVNIDRRRIIDFCHTVDPRFLAKLNEKKPKTMGELADIWYGILGGGYSRSEHYNRSRYHMLNLHACFTKGTIEFRLFQFDNPGHGTYKGGLHAGKLKAYIQLCLALSQMAKQVRSASPKKPQMENQKYAMRIWLLRMGFIGPEFETARKWLTDRLPGDTAFRNGRTA